MLFLRDDYANIISDYEVINQPMLICTFVAILLFGVTCAQTFYYFHRFPNDSYKIRCMIASIWLFEAAHSALLVNVINHVLIVKAGDLLSLSYIYHCIPIAYAFGYLSTYLVNLFYVWRINTISRNPIMFAIVGILATARFGAELSFCIMSYIDSDWVVFADVLLTPLLTSLALSAAVDCVIAASMTYYLRQGRTSFAQTRSIVNRLIRYVMGSGMLTFLFTTAIMLSLLIPQSSINSALTFFALIPVQSKLYTNSLLVSLNSRDPRDKGARNGTEVSSYKFEAHRRTASGSDVTMLDTYMNRASFLPASAERM